MLNLKTKEDINREIDILRDKLNKQIEENDDYENILKTSVKLDKIINKYYFNTQIDT